MVKRSNSKKVRERNILRVNEPSESKGTKEIAEEISERSHGKPEGIDGSEKGVKLLKRNLEEKE